MEHRNMTEVTTSARKDDHIRINLERDVQSDTVSTGLERLYFEHQALPEIDMAAVDTNLTVFGRQLSSPLLISCMTGGSARSGEINRALANAAQYARVALGLGSMRVAIENPETVASFQVRDIAPDVLLMANIGAVQLNYGIGVEDCRRIIEMSKADALVMHFNALQEAVQPGGDTDFSGLLAKVEQVCTALARDEIPVVAKEVGWGFSEDTCRALASAGVAAIDVAGAGGTSWSQVEMYRAEDETEKKVAAAFQDWGIPTAKVLKNVRCGAPDIIAIASGGLRDGVDVAKCIALGASLAGMARPFLEAASRSPEEVLRALRVIEHQLRVSMFCAGSADIDELKRTPLMMRQ
jgi:isopentenyl-diphosphate delta-isomerase